MAWRTFAPGRTRPPLRTVGSVALSVLVTAFALFALAMLYWCTLARCGTGLTEAWFLAFIVGPCLLLWSRQLGRKWSDAQGRLEWNLVARWAWMVAMASTLGAFVAPLLLNLLSPFQK